MNISIDQAQRIADEYLKENSCQDFGTGVVEGKECWFFPIGFIGSSGILINKSDGKLYVMGSALNLESMFWGHERGFSEEEIDLEIYEVNNPLKVSGLVGDILCQLELAPIQPMRAARELAREQLKELPKKYSGINLWLSIPWFIEAEKENWLKYKIFKSA